MMRSLRWLLLGGLALLPTAAYASDFSGVVTMLYGIPGLLVAIVAAAGFLAFPPSRRQRLLAAVVFLPVLAAGAWVLAWDTSQMMQRGQPDDLLLSAGYVLLLILLIGLVARILLRPLAPEASAENAAL